jgi:hypothetical protein
LGQGRENSLELLQTRLDLFNKIDQEVRLKLASGATVSATQVVPSKDDEEVVFAED